MGSVLTSVPCSWGPGKTEAVRGAMDWVEALFAHIRHFGLLRLSVLLRRGGARKRGSNAHARLRFVRSVSSATAPGAVTVMPVLARARAA